VNLATHLLLVSGSLTRRSDMVLGRRDSLKLNLPELLVHVPQF
jgi:hypothetical protein